MIRLAKHRPHLVAMACVVLLSACGGGDTDGSDPDVATVIDDGDSQPGGRAQALAYTLPPIAPAPAGLGGNVVCTNLSLGAVVVDNLEVPAGAGCRLNGTTVRGSVQMQPDSVLLASGTRITGNVQADRASHVQVTGSTSSVGGSVQLVGGGSATLSSLRVTGDIFLEGLADVVATRQAVVGGNLQAIDNRGGIEISGNRITGNLQCSGNLPAPLVSGNSAAQFEGQCRAGGTGGAGGSGGTPPLSGNVSCVGLTIGAIGLDSVIVPAGASCTLMGTRLIGNIEVGAGARLLADNVRVNGSLKAEGAAELGVGGASTVGGSVQIKGGGPATLVGMSVTGDLQIDDMQGAVNAANNRITGNLQAMANRGGLALNGNRMGGVMQCKDNLPAPTGTGNVATLKEDQCLGL